MRRIYQVFAILLFSISAWSEEPISYGTMTLPGEFKQNCRESTLTENKKKTDHEVELFVSPSKDSKSKGKILITDCTRKVINAEGREERKNMYEWLTPDGRKIEFFPDMESHTSDTPDYDVFSTLGCKNGWTKIPPRPFDTAIWIFFGKCDLAYPSTGVFILSRDLVGENSKTNDKRVFFRETEIVIHEIADGFVYLSESPKEPNEDEVIPDEDPDVVEYCNEMLAFKKKKLGREATSEELERLLISAKDAAKITRRKRYEEKSRNPDLHKVSIQNFQDEDMHLPYRLY